MWNLQISTLPLQKLEKYLWSGTLFNVILKLLDVTTFVKCEAASITYHSIIKGKLQFLFQNHRA